MRHPLTSPVALGLLIAGIALPWASQAQPPKAPCKQIAEACKGAGFVEGDFRQGYGLWRDCIDPIMHGTKQPANADKPLPSVSTSLIEACRQKNPNFGQGGKAPAK